MAGQSPTTIADATLQLTVFVNGVQINDTYPVSALEIKHEINRISYAYITIIDGEIETGDFPISDSDDLIPGNSIEITAGYGDDSESSIFNGVIVKQGLEIDEEGNYNMLVTCKHEAVKMTFNRTEAEFPGKTDSDIIQSIVSTYGLSATVDGTTPTQESMFQKAATDWDFILTRAGFYGFIVCMDGDSIVIGKPAISGDGILSVMAGDDIRSFKAELSAERQLPEVNVSAWDIASLSLTSSTASEPGVNAMGNLQPKALASKLSQTGLKLTSSTPMAADELKAWADGRLLTMRLSAIKGEVSFQGSALAKTGTLIDLAGVGDRYNGSAFISAVTHTFTDNDWMTMIRFGLDDTPLNEQIPYSYAPASGFLPAMQGLQIGIVKQIANDPDSLYRIMVTLPSSAADQTGFWARMSNPYATDSSGIVFLPEVGDEVIIGFMENDPRYPVILGSLYSSTKTNPAPAADENNYIKSITTKSQLNITFDDEKKSILIQTPGGNKITFSDDAQSISIEDQNSNSIKMTSSGINLKSAGDIVLNATGNITLDATGKVSVTAQQDVAVTGMNVNNTAQIGFTAKGNATAEISASGQTVVKGAIVMIN